MVSKGGLLTPESWLKILASAYSLFEDAEARGFGMPPFALGGGTVSARFGMRAA